MLKIYLSIKKNNNKLNKLTIILDIYNILKPIFWCHFLMVIQDTVIPTDT